jgi:GNAT superfamily N-acetyltransferase
MNIRPLKLTDKAEWLPLWQGYQAFYKTDIPSTTTDITFSRFLNEAEPMFAFVAEDDGHLIGMVHYIFHRSCWTVNDYVYLQDLYVHSDIRGKGVGRKLIEAVYEEATRKGASRVHWLTQEDNNPARFLYDTIADRTGFIQYRKIF